MLIGFVYPAYASWKALEAPREASAGETSTQGRDAWLTYWVAFSTFNVVEHLLDWLVYWCEGAARTCSFSQEFTRPLLAPF
jgi:hypothetical protein